MGMYATVEGREIKMAGLLAKLVVEEASRWPQEWPGVSIVEHDDQPLIDGGTATLSRENVRTIVIRMRDAFVHEKRTSQYNVWAQDASLTHIQDIFQFRADVEAFTVLADWHVFERGTELHWG